MLQIGGTWQAATRTYICSLGVERGGEWGAGDALPANLQQWKSRTRNFLDKFFICDDCHSLTECANIRRCSNASWSRSKGCLIYRENIERQPPVFVGKTAHRQTKFSRNCGIYVQPAAFSLIGHHGNLRDGFTRRAASGSKSVPQGFSESFESSASLGCCVFISRVSDVNCVLLPKQSLALTTNAANCSWDRCAKAAKHLPMCSNPFLE